MCTPPPFTTTSPLNIQWCALVRASEPLRAGDGSGEGNVVLLSHVKAFGDISLNMAVTSARGGCRSFLMQGKSLVKVICREPAD